MRRAAWRPLVVLLTAAWLASSYVVAAPASRIVAIGDVHGAGEAFVSILQRAGLIDAQRRWTGGTTVFVQTGDLLDRGTAVREVLDLLMALEPQAASGRRSVAAPARQSRSDESARRDP